jgi:hypothetical protein
VLQEDLDLADVVASDRRAHASDSLTASVMRLGPGPLAAEAAAPLPGGLGLLVLEGIVMQRLGVRGRFGAELLGECDLLRPWQLPEGSSPMLEVAMRWTVLEPSRVAVLDASFAAASAPYPEIAARLIARSVSRARNLVVNMAIVHQARVDVRLHMLLWHLAGRWGRVRSDGTVLPLRLTHAVLADLVAARRPTVTSALAELGRQGHIRWLDEGWLLIGNPPTGVPGS